VNQVLVACQDWSVLPTYYVLRYIYISSPYCTMLMQPRPGKNMAPCPSHAACNASRIPLTACGGGGSWIVFFISNSPKPVPQPHEPGRTFGSRERAWLGLGGVGAGSQARVSPILVTSSRWKREWKSRPVGHPISRMWAVTSTLRTSWKAKSTCLTMIRSLDLWF
jgi:hypothetical protein